MERFEFVALGFLGVTGVKLGETNERAWAEASQAGFNASASIELFNGLGLTVGLVQHPAHQEVRPGIVR